jgi:hypothetical protein
MNPTPPIPANLISDLKAAAARAATGVHDPEVMRQACERMDRMREDLRAHSGEMDVAVELVREARYES